MGEYLLHLYSTIGIPSQAQQPGQPLLPRLASSSAAALHCAGHGPARAQPKQPSTQRTTRGADVEGYQVSRGRARMDKSSIILAENPSVAADDAPGEVGAIAQAAARPAGRVTAVDWFKGFAIASMCMLHYATTVLGAFRMDIHSTDISVSGYFLLRSASVRCRF